MTIETRRFKSPAEWEPWKAMAVAAGVGAALMGAGICLVTLLLRSLHS